MVGVLGVRRSWTQDEFDDEVASKSPLPSALRSLALGDLPASARGSVYVPQLVAAAVVTFIPAPSGRRSNARETRSRAARPPTRASPAGCLSRW